MAFGYFGRSLLFAGVASAALAFGGCASSGDSSRPSKKCVFNEEGEGFALKLTVNFSGGPSSPVITEMKRTTLDLARLAGGAHFATHTWFVAQFPHLPENQNEIGERQGEWASLSLNTLPKLQEVTSLLKQQGVTTLFLIDKMGFQFDEKREHFEADPTDEKALIQSLYD